MTRLREPARPRPGLRNRGLLVCVLLMGLLAMHGLGQVPTPTSASGHHRTAGGDRPDAAAASVPVLCGHDGRGRDGRGRDDHGSGGHAEHADETCAAASVAGSPSPHAQALALTAVGGTERPAAPASLPVSSPDGGRAPPSLSELQLLRI